MPNFEKTDGDLLDEVGRDGLGQRQSHGVLGPSEAGDLLFERSVEHGNRVETDVLRPRGDVNSQLCELSDLMAINLVEVFQCLLGKVSELRVWF